MLAIGRRATRIEEARFNSIARHIATIARSLGSDCSTSSGQGWSDVDAGYMLCKLTDWQSELDRMQVILVEMVPGLIDGTDMKHFSLKSSVSETHE